MARRPALLAFCAVLAVASASCSGTPAAAKRQASPRPATHVAGKVTRPGPAAAPAVRMFAGVQSAVGAVSQYCTRPCGIRAVSPPRLVVVAGSIVTFAVQPAPDQAVLTITGSGTTRVALAPGTLLAYQGRLAGGSHRLTLQLRWGGTSGIWLWDVTVAAG